MRRADADGAAPRLLTAPARLMFSFTVVATTGEQFADFTPYVASINDAGTVAFEATLRGGGSGVFAGAGGRVEELVRRPLDEGVTSHPDLNEARSTSFYGELPEGGQGVFLCRDGRVQTVADTHSGFASIGPLGPTMNEAGTVAFRADPADGVSGIFAADGAAVSRIADTTDRWSRFQGLPVITGDGTVVFRADCRDGVQGIYAGRSGSMRAVAESGERFASLSLFPSANESGTIAFAATLRGGGQGVFTDDDGRIACVTDADAFETYRGALITNAGAVVIIATPRARRLGLFAGPDPAVDRILALGDALLDSTVEDFAANPVSVNGIGQVAIRASLADGRQVILRADPAG
jgi:hypothetical protein